MGKEFVMLLSKEAKLIFFHIPKTAGTSIKDYMIRNTKDGMFYSRLFYDRYIKHYDIKFKSFGEISQGISSPYFSHITQVECTELLKDLNFDFDGFSEIVIVRNPYDRLLSYFNFILYNNYNSIDKLLDSIEASSDIRHKIYFRSQLDYISKPITKNLKIFKYEEISKCQEFLQISLNTNESLSQKNVTKYTQALSLDQYLKDRCYEIFQEEFETLGYNK